jgi:hypothetical protein
MGLASTHLPCTALSQASSASGKPSSASYNCFRISYDCSVSFRRRPRVGRYHGPDVVVCASSDVANPGFAQGAQTLPTGVNRGRTLTPSAAYVSASEESYGLFGHEVTAFTQLVRRLFLPELHIPT